MLEDEPLERGIADAIRLVVPGGFGVRGLLRLSDRAGDLMSWRASAEHHGFSVIGSHENALQHYAWQIADWNTIALTGDHLMRHGDLRLGAGSPRRRRKLLLLVRRRRRRRRRRILRWHPADRVRGDLRRQGLARLGAGGHVDEWTDSLPPITMPSSAGSAAREGLTAASRPLKRSRVGLR